VVDAGQRVPAAPRQYGDAGATGIELHPILGFACLTS
jgi:hypothetical protein